VKTRLCLTLCAVLILMTSLIPAGSSRPTFAQNNAPVFEPADCQFALPEGQTVDCGYLIVPEDRSNPDSPTIRLHVATFRSQSANPAPDPIVYLEGGPGGDALEGVELVFNTRFASFLQNRDFIVFDQRGTGYSEPSLACPELTEFTYETLDDDLTAEEAATASLEAYQQCRDRLVGAGVNLSAYNSAENAADLADLRVALGYEEWNLFGISYGTRLALTTMRDHPEGIRSVILDSTYPLEVNLYAENPVNMERAFDVFFAGCAADPECSAAYPDLEATFYDLVEKLNDEYITISITHPFTGESYDALINGDAIVGFLFQALYATEIIPLLPQVIYAVQNEDYGFFGQLEGAFLANIDFFSAGMQQSVQCSEEISFSQPEDLASATENYPEFESYFERTMLDETLFQLCTLWDVAAADAVENEPVTSDIPTLVLAGEYDPVTPPAWGQQVAAVLPNSYFFEFPGVGHGASISGECPLSVTLAFLDDPTTEPDAACVAEMAGPDFALPLTDITLVPFTNEVFQISGVIPEGWAEVGAGTYAPSRTSQYAIVQQAVPGANLDLVLEALQGQLGLEAAPESTDTREANGLSWTLYSMEAQGALVDLAMAESETHTFIVVLISTASEHDLLYEEVFLPAIDALVATE